MKYEKYALFQGSNPKKSKQQNKMLDETIFMMIQMIVTIRNRYFVVLFFFYSFSGLF